MHYVDVAVDITKLSTSTLEWIKQTGDTIAEPEWTIRPYKLNDDELTSIEPLLQQLPVQPDYVAIIMVPANTVCKTHVDNIGGRYTALNIGIQIDNEKSLFQYMDDDDVIESVSLDTPKLWAVDIPHRVDNSAYDKNRVVLSLGYKHKFCDLYDKFN